MSLPRSDSQAAFDSIQEVFRERNFPCSPIAAARCGFEAAVRINNSDKPCQKAPGVDAPCAKGNVGCTVHPVKTPNTPVIVLEGLLTWLEKWNTLHWSVNVLYVVAGYEVEVCYDHTTKFGPFQSQTLKDAYFLAMKATEGYTPVLYNVPVDVTHPGA